MTAPAPLGDVELAELRAVEADMSEAPWQLCPLTEAVLDASHQLVLYSIGDAVLTWSVHDRDGALILRNAAPALLATITAQAERVRVLEAGLREAEAYVCRATLAANLPREAWSDACHARTILRALLPTEGVKP